MNELIKKILMIIENPKKKIYSKNIKKKKKQIVIDLKIYMKRHHNSKAI